MPIAQCPTMQSRAEHGGGQSSSVTSSLVLLTATSWPGVHCAVHFVPEILIRKNSAINSLIVEEKI